jgi:hypothetical protein
MRVYFYILGFFITTSITAQQVEVDFDAVDSLYREDQFYFSVSYSTMQNQPEGFKQSKFSPAISLGFLRDMPINKNRTLAIAAGIGYSLSMYNQNMVVSKTAEGYGYFPIPEGESLDKSRFIFHSVDVPIEFRWRNSTPETYKFWRVYTGVKVSYVFYNQYKLGSSLGNYSITNNNDDINKIQYGVYASVGWNTVNLYAYYGLNSFFKSSVKSNGESLDLNALHLGLMFYIL